MTKKIANLESNAVIIDYEGLLEYLLLSIVTAHQESCDYVETYIWRLCVSYHPFNKSHLASKFIYLVVLIVLMVLKIRMVHYL